MKTGILASALALVMWGGAALADDSKRADCPPEQLDSAQSGLTEVDETAVVEEEGVGGSGWVEEDIAAVEVDADEECPPYGGSGDVGTDIDAQQQELESDRPEAMTPAPAPAPAPSTTVVVEQPAISMAEPQEEKDRSNMRGVTVLLGGGVEGYTGALAPEVDPGVSWGVGAAFRPTTLLGLELTYSGAANELDTGIGGGATSGADVVRNGGEALATIGLTPTAVQPYLLGGVGLSHYNVREEVAGFQDDTNGSVPLGAGLRTHIGGFTADARDGYSFLFDQDFAPAGEESVLGADNFSDAGRYSGMIRLGSTF